MDNADQMIQISITLWNMYGYTPEEEQMEPEEFIRRLKLRLGNLVSFTSGILVGTGVQADVIEELMKELKEGKYGRKE